MMRDGRNGWAAAVLATGVVCMTASTALADGFDELVKQVGKVPDADANDAWDDAGLKEKVSDEAIARRKGMVVRAAAADPRTRRAGGAKHRVPPLLCELKLDPANANALKHLPMTASYPGISGDDFGHISLARVLCQFGDKLEPESIAAIRRAVTSCDMTLKNNTENHVSNRRTAAFLIGERFPNDRFHYGLNGKQMAAVCRDYMRKYGRTLFASGQGEYLSPTYHGVNMAAWSAVAEFANDDTARLMGQAIIDYLLIDYAANYHHGILVAPLQREKGLMSGHYQTSYASSTGLWSGWIYWGGGTTPQGGGAFPDTKYLPLQPYGLAACQLAVSAWNPHPVIRHVGAKRLRTPYMLWQARPDWYFFRSCQYNAYGSKPPKKHRGPKPNLRSELRSVYVDRDYAIGASYRHGDEEAYQRTHQAFSIVYKSKDDHNYLMAVHPYYYTAYQGTYSPDRVLGDEDWMGVSPFMRMVHWENAVVVLWDIPETDPYKKPGRGSSKFISKRTARCVQSGFLYVPETIDERKQVGDDFFLREGDTYIGIRPLVKGAGWGKTIHKGWTRLVLPGAVTGAAIEVGDRREFGSFEAFRKKFAGTKLDVGQLHSQRRAAYRSTRGHSLSVRSVEGTWLPDSRVNGTKLDFARWPICQSPYVTCRDRVLDVNDGHNGFTIDWRGDVPKYAHYEITAAGRKRSP